MASLFGCFWDDIAEQLKDNATFGLATDRDVEKASWLYASHIVARQGGMIDARDGSETGINLATPNFGSQVRALIPHVNLSMVVRLSCMICTYENCKHVLIHDERPVITHYNDALPLDS